jgi:hypothetical protein
MWRRNSLSAAMLVCWAWSATADNVAEVGVLTCTLGNAVGASTDDETPGAQMREGLCIFQPKQGMEETYSAKVQGVSFLTDAKASLMWVVKSAVGSKIELGLLEQSFASDRKTPADQRPPLIGEPNAAIALHSMADKSEGSASAPQKPAPTGFVVLNVELKLRSASG